MSQYQTILVEQMNGVLEITLNRPEKYNALTMQVASELLTTCELAASDPTIRCLLLTGAGKGFCTGQDLDEAAGGSNFPFTDNLKVGYNGVILALHRLEKPVIAAINGAAAGAGMGIALACDIRYLSERAQFIPAFTGIGSSAGAGASYWLPRLIGLARTAELLFTNQRIGAAQAVELGLANKVFPHETFLQEARQLAQQLAGAPTLAIGLIKRALNHSHTATFEQQLALEVDLLQISGASADYQEGLAAFRQKRRPVFSGR